jgi:hypothetical protein
VPKEDPTRVNRMASMYADAMVEAYGKNFKSEDLLPAHDESKSSH